MTNLSRTNLNNGAAVGPQGEGRESPSTFPTYPAYKDSGVEWLGDVPEHWGVSPLKWLAEQVTDKATTSEFQVGLENIEGWTGRFIETDTEFAGDGIAFRQEDILFGKLRPYLAKVWLADRPGQAVGDFFVLRPRAVNGEFLHKYILTPTVIEDLNASTIGAKMPRVGWEDLAALAVSLPPYKEQTQIARFLDHETARIDALIEEQQRLIELLKEKRQAVISHAVTKGLDPTVPMKDSGVEWLGEVPAHWETWKLTHAFGGIGSGTTPPSTEYGWYEDGTIPWITTSELRESVITATKKSVTEDALRKFSALQIHPPGSLAIAMYGATIGRLGILGISATTNQACCVLSSPRFLAPKFTFYWLNGFREIIISLYATGGGQPNINQDTVASLKVPAPNIEEQRLISDFLDQKAIEHDSLVKEAERVVVFLQERRSALISAAVTGKIDVRDWQPPASTQAPKLVVSEAD